MKRPPINQNGFSLLELLVAITIMSIGLFAAAGMQLVAMNSNTIAHKLSVATSIAQEAMEDIMSWSPDDSRLNANASDTVYDLDTKTTATTVTVQGAGTFSAKHSTTINTPVIGVTQIEVKVYKVINGVSEANPYVRFTSYKRITS